MGSLSLWHWLFVLIFLGGIGYAIYATNRKKRADNEPVGLGGWLVLVGFGLVLTPFGLLFQLLDYLPYFTDENVSALIRPGSPTYNPELTIIIYVELIVRIFLTLLSLVALYLFFNKRRAFPRVYITLWVILPLWILIDSLVANAMVPQLPISWPEVYRYLTTSVITGTIWSLYMLRSRRVKLTFTEQGSQLPSPRLKWLSAIASIAAFWLAYGLFIPVGSIGRQWFDNFTTTDADIRADIEREVANESKTYQAMRQYFPHEYEAMINSTIADIRNRTDNTDAMREGAEFVASLRKQNAANYQMASVESLRQHLRSTLPQYDYLRDKYGYQACNAMAVGGGMALLPILGDKYTKDKTLMSLFDESSGFFFTIAAEGMTVRLQHAQPTDADWGDAVQSMIGTGMTEVDFELIANSQKHIDDPRLCDVTVKWLDGITKMDNDAAQRIIPFIAGGMAAN